MEQWRVTIFWTIQGVRKWVPGDVHLWHGGAFFHGYSDFGWLFAFGQVRPHRLAGVELVFQRDDFGSDVTTGGRGLLESVIGGESGHHVRMSGHEDPQADPRDLRSGVYEGDRFQFYRRRTV